MKKQLCLILAILLSLSAYGQYRIVQGKVVPRNSPNWTALRDRMEVIGFLGGALICRSFTESSVTTGSVGNRANPFGPSTRSVRNYTDTFILTNFPSAGRFHKGDVIPGGIAAMRVDGSGSYALYDYGVDYVPPQRQLTPEEAAAAKAQLNKGDAEKEAVKLRFDQEQADKGKDLYQYRMGLRYLKGNGVTGDLTKAREYFSKAAAQGNEDAAAELRKLASQ